MNGFDNSNDDPDDRDNDEEAREAEVPAVFVDELELPFADPDDLRADWPGTGLGTLDALGVATGVFVLENSNAGGTQDSALTGEFSAEW